jgi:LDH2 family malate/lactate/ureidoglycolate dehydrogenase
MIDAPTHRVPVGVLTAFTHKLLQNHGLSDEHAEIMTANLVEADMRGIKSHGHFLVSRYSEWLDDGYMNPQPNIRIVNETSATVLVDADCGPGHLAGAFTMQIVIAKAGESGCATGLTRQSRHYGAAAHYALMAASRDMIGYSATNAGPTMFAFGGRERVIGNNPIAYAIPTGPTRPLVLDMAMSTAANGRIAIMQRLGQELPQGWALDKLGQPTTNPADFFDDGAGAPIGGPKGIGLAQIVDVVAGVLSGSGYGPSVGRADGESGTIGHTFQAIDVESFMPIDRFYTRIADQVKNFHESSVAEGTDEIVVPGELEWRAFDDAVAHGIPLIEPIITDLNAVAKRKHMADRL